MSLWICLDCREITGGSGMNGPQCASCGSFNMERATILTSLPPKKYPVYDVPKTTCGEYYSWEFK